MKNCKRVSGDIMYEVTADMFKIYAHKSIIKYSPNFVREHSQSNSMFFFLLQVIDKTTTLKFLHSLHVLLSSL